MRRIGVPLLFFACLTLGAFAIDRTAPLAHSQDLVATSSRLAAWDVYDERLADLETQVHELTKGQGGQKSSVVGEQSRYAGFSFLFAKAHMKESFEATITNVAPPGSLTLVPLDTEFELTPRVWLGMTNNQGLGWRVTYWHYDHGGNSQTFVSDGVNLPGATVTTVIFPASIIAAVPGDRLTTSNRLQVSTLDAEGTIDLQLGTLQMRAAAGLRYARIHQRQSAAVTGILPASLDWTREFEGIGPTISANVSQPLLRNISAIGVVRGSLLYGEKSLQRAVVNDMTPLPGRGVPVVNLHDADEVTAGFELALGAQWQRELASGHQLVVQGMYEGQLWTDAGAPTLTFLGFEGFSASLGVIW